MKTPSENYDSDVLDKGEEIDYFQWKRLEYKNRGSKYPWDIWFNGKTWKIVAGEDFDCKTKTMREQIYQKASEMGYRVRTHVNKKTGDIFFQRYAVREPQTYQEVKEALEAAGAGDEDVPTTKDGTPDLRHQQLAAGDGRLDREWAIRNELQGNYEQGDPQ